MKLTALTILVFTFMPWSAANAAETASKPTSTPSVSRVKPRARTPSPQPTPTPEPVTEEPETPSVTDKIGDMASKAGEKTQEAIHQVGSILNESQSRRAASSYIVMANYAPFDLLIPSKIGASAGLVRSQDSTIEVEYLRGSISVPFVIEDLGQISDARLSLLKRSYLGSNSFNIHYGISYFMIDLKVGSEILNRTTAGAFSSDLVSTRALGFVAGIGNRWTFTKNITLGVDWLSWAQPVYLTQKDTPVLDYVTNQNDRDNIETAIKVASYFPRFSLLKVQFGMSF